MGIYKREITDDKVISDFEILYEQYLAIKDKLDKQEKRLNKIYELLTRLMPYRVFIPMTAGAVIGGLVISPILQALIR